MTDDPQKESWNLTPMALCDQIPVAVTAHYSATSKVPVMEGEDEGELVVVQDPEQQEFVEPELTAYGTLRSDQLLLLQPATAPLVSLE